MLQRGDEVILKMLPNVQQATIRPIIEANVASGSLIYTDEYNIYDRLPDWGFEHKTVNHSIGEYARDDDGDQFHELHVNTIEGFWLRPHRGISQEKLPLYLGFFEFIHNVRLRGKALLPSLILALLAPPSYAWSRTFTNGHQMRTMWLVSGLWNWRRASLRFWRKPGPGIYY